MYKYIILTILLVNSIYGIDLTNEEKEYIKNKKVLKICADPFWYSFNYLNYNNEEDVTTSLAKVVLNKIDLKKKLIYTRSSMESLVYIQEKKCDLISRIQKNEKKSKFIKYTKSYFHYHLMLVSRVDSDYLYNLKNLQNKKIAILKNHNGIKVLKEKYKNINIVYVHNAKEGMIKVHNKEVYGYIDLLPSIKTHIHKVKGIKINRELDSELSLSLGIRNDNIHLFNILNKSLISINDIEKHNIFNKVVDVENNDNSMYKIPWELLVCSIIFILLILYWNLQLKRGIKRALLKSKKQESLLFYYSKKDAMKDLVGNISHQWRQPVNELSSVLLYIETKIHLKQNLTSEEIENSVRKARKIINYLSKTVTVFTNFYLDKANVNNVHITRIIKQALYIIEGTFRENKIEIKLDIQKRKAEVIGEDLQQVILSIFSNIKNIVIEKKIKNALITIRLYDNDKYNILEIEDNCGGITDSNINIFDLGETNIKGGTGLGLFIAKRIIEDKYKGNIIVNNTSNGAIFTINLPKN
jgi:signal transduction histidine kinase